MGLWGGCRREKNRKRRFGVAKNSFSDRLHQDNLKMHGKRFAALGTNLTFDQAQQ